MSLNRNYKPGSLETWSRDENWSALTGSRSSHLHDFRVHKRKLKEKLFGVLVPVDPELALLLLDLPTWYFECDRLVGFGSEEEILPFTVWRLNLLLVGRHEAMSRYDAVADFRIIDLEQQRLLSAFRISLLCHSITRTTNFHELLGLDSRLLRLK